MQIYLLYAKKMRESKRENREQPGCLHVEDSALTKVRSDMTKFSACPGCSACCWSRSGGGGKVRHQVPADLPALLDRWALEKLHSLTLKTCIQIQCIHDVAVEVIVHGVLGLVADGPLIVVRHEAAAVVCVSIGSLSQGHGWW